MYQPSQWLKVATIGENAKGSNVSLKRNLNVIKNYLTRAVFSLLYLGLCMALGLNACINHLRCSMCQASEKIKKVQSCH